MKYSLCIEPVFEKVDFYDRIKLAEYWPTYDDKKSLADVFAYLKR